MAKRTSRGPRRAAAADGPAPGSPLAGKRVLVGVTGSIAAYKAGDLVRELGRCGATVVVVMTASAKRLVTPETFRALTGREVYSELFPDPPERTLGDPFAPADQPIHIKLAAQSDLVVVAPATANVLAKMAAGIADDLLSTLLLVARCPILAAPAMNPYMLDHPTVRTNLAALVARGVRIVEPEVGLLACGYEGEGKLAEVATIVEAAERVAAMMPPGPGRTLGAPGDEGAAPRAPARPLAGRRVLVTAGRTEEPIDPVRFLSNRSSGRMGFALAAEARDRGASVVVVAGRTDVPAPLGVEVVRAETAAAMAGATRARAADADVVLMCAAVADWTPARPARDKIKKAKGAPTLALAPTEDILAGLGAAKKNGTLLVGFALETARPLEEGRRKLRDKRLDLVVVNAAGEPGSGPGATANRVTLIDRRGKSEALPLLPKPEVAARILDRVEALLAGTRR